MPAPSRMVALRRRVLADMLDGSFSGLARAGGLLPQAAPERHGVERIAGIPYRPGGGPEHQLDVYRPQGAAGPLPAVLYLHGGAFRALSKDTHWLMGIAFARRGYVVLSVNYRLAPRHPFPAAAEDACAAWTFATRNVGRWGGDPGRMAVAGESAGANLASVVAVASAWRRPEPWAREVYDAGARPVAALPACGILQVSETERFRSNRIASRLASEIIANVEDGYLPRERSGLDLALADPLCVVERCAPDRAPPPFFLPVGTWDPLLRDSERMAAALASHGVEAVLRTYAREPHAFHALVWRPQARLCWRDMFEFLGARVSSSG